MHSIRTKITVLTMAAILATAVCIGWIGIAAIKGQGDRASGEIMSLICDNCRGSIDEYLNSIEQSVDLVSRYALDEVDRRELVRLGVLPGTDGGPFQDGANRRQQEQLDAYLAEYSGEVEGLFHSIANHTNGVIAFYFRYNPELSPVTKGFFYAKTGGSKFFSKVEPTELSMYDRDDVEHVGWYYIPVSRGLPSWLEPYENQNLGVTMFSYVAPLYVDGELLGVVGMDVGYDTLLSQLENIQIYDSGFAWVLSPEGRVIYHPQFPPGTPFAQVEAAYDPNPGDRDTLSWMLGEELSEIPMRYQWKAGARQMVFTTLSSGWKLIVSAPVEEINAPWLRMIHNVLLTAGLLLMGFTGVVLFLMKQLTRPLKRLTQASQELSAGNYDVQLDYEGQDEVGILTQAFQQLVQHLKIYISDLNSRAYRDAMTGVRNKGAFELMEQNLDEAIQSASPEAPMAFALVMLDCNNLKEINDTYGHEKGDVYLQTACQFICDVFPHSPVFRLGGDEFGVVLTGTSYQQREELLRVFQGQAAQRNAMAAQPWQHIDIALGLSIYDPERDRDVSDVLNRADAQMYAFKKAMKADRPAIK